MSNSSMRAQLSLLFTDKNLFENFNEIEDIGQLKRLGIFCISESSELLRMVEYKVKQELNKKKGFPAGVSRGRFLS